MHSSRMRTARFSGHLYRGVVSTWGCLSRGCAGRGVSREVSREGLHPLDLEADTRLPHCTLGYTPPTVDRQTPVKILL